MPPPRVLILYNEPTLPGDHHEAAAEHDVLNTVAAVASELTAAHFDISRLGISYDPGALLEGVREYAPNVVFNLFEGTAQRGETEAYVAGLLEWLGLPFTGSPPETLCLARNKPLTKHLLCGAGLPTPAFRVVEERPRELRTFRWPVIVKPANQDASVGLEQASVVTDRALLEARVRETLQRYGPPVLVEEFIDGRELTVAVVECPELRTLPISEILFLDKTPGTWPIVTYDAKWKPDSPACQLTPVRYPAEVEPALAEQLRSLALRAFRLLGCRDYARIDFRVSPDGAPYILEVNPNPDFNQDAGFTAGLQTAGMAHATFAVQLVRNALARGESKKKPLRKPGKQERRR